MNHSPREELQLSRIFRSMNDLAYCVIKCDERLPGYGRGSDIDIFCLDLPAVSRRLLVLLGEQLGPGHLLDVQDDGHYSKIDLVEQESGELVFRFDLYGGLPPYRHVALRPALFESVLEGRVEKRIGQGDEECTISVPSQLDDLLLRYVEYHEWYAERPDKIKHLAMVLDSPLVERRQLLDKLHHYVSLPTPQPLQPAHVPRVQALKDLLRKTPLIHLVRLARRGVHQARHLLRRHTGLFRD